MMEKESIFKCHVCFRVCILLRKCLFFQLTFLSLVFRSYPIWPVHGRMPCASLGQVWGLVAGSWVVVSIFLLMFSLSFGKDGPVLTYDFQLG